MIRNFSVTICSTYTSQIIYHQNEVLCPYNCTAGKGKSIFGVPKNENSKKQWETILGIFLKSKYRVCVAHFHETDIIKNWVVGQGL